LAKISILAIGKLRSAEAEWCAEYLKRLKGEVTIKELAAPKSLPPDATQKAEAELLLKVVPSKTFVVLLDERGKDLTSRELATKISGWQEQNAEMIFLIGGADGVIDKVRARANFTLGLGRATWPHRLVRVMLLEQLYRAQQINAGHPYHRD
jgi:23S rRNA (pseudouridine1915-N3)-methyltransferase